MLNPLTGKDKAARVPLAYFRQPRKGRRLAIVAALGITVIALVASIATGYWRQLASPGPVHYVHAAWENNCAVCHDPMKPATSHNGLQKMLGTGEVSNDLCKRCHDGTFHHPQHVNMEEVPNCSGCHVEHRGRTALISKVPDRTCTRCHENLPAHSKEGKTAYATEITRFDRNHPQFRLGDREHRVELGQALDPGKLRFNHKLHLTEGIRYSDKDAGIFRLEDIKDDGLRKQYMDLQKTKNPKDKVQLECFSCHQMDVSDAQKNVSPLDLPARSSGEYVLPVNYDQHCKACHPLTFSPDLPNVQVPHHLQPEDVRRFLWGVFASQETREIEKKVAEEKPAPGRELPGRDLVRQQKEAQERIRGKVVSAESFLYQTERDKALKFIFPGKTTCGECHEYAKKQGEMIPDRILPTKVPQLWYPHAKFSHYAHRAADCLTCHEGARKSELHTDVLLPGRQNCLNCHSQSRWVDGKKFGGVREDCSTCHRYHQGDVPEAGIGARARGPKGGFLSIQEFLNPVK
jgi:hypothetical protein